MQVFDLKFVMILLELSAPRVTLKALCSKFSVNKALKAIEFNRRAEHMDILSAFLLLFYIYIYSCFVQQMLHNSFPLR